MNDDIKELIEELKDSYGIAMPKQEYFGYIKGIEDYITNLQQENENLTKENEKWWAIIKDYEMDVHDLWFRNNELEEAQKNFEKQFIKEIDYKSRIEKAVEYIKEARKQDFMWSPIFMKELLNILNGRSDE